MMPSSYAIDFGVPESSWSWTCLLARQFCETHNLCHGGNLYHYLYAANHYLWWIALNVWHLWLMIDSWSFETCCVIPRTDPAWFAPPRRERTPSLWAQRVQHLHKPHGVKTIWPSLTNIRLSLDPSDIGCCTKYWSRYVDPNGLTNYNKLLNVSKCLLIAI